MEKSEIRRLREQIKNTKIQILRTQSLVSRTKSEEYQILSEMDSKIDRVCDLVGERLRQKNKEDYLVFLGLR